MRVQLDETRCSGSMLANFEISSSGQRVIGLQSKPEEPIKVNGVEYFGRLTAKEQFDKSWRSTTTIRRPGTCDRPTDRASHTLRDWIVRIAPALAEANVEKFNLGLVEQLQNRHDSLESAAAEMRRTANLLDSFAEMAALVILGEVEMIQRPREAPECIRWNAPHYRPHGVPGVQCDGGAQVVSALVMGAETVGYAVDRGDPAPLMVPLAHVTEVRPNWDRPYRRIQK